MADHRPHFTPIGPARLYTARKAHRCDLCGCEIVPGARYARWALGNGEGFAHFSAHPSCLETFDDDDALEDGWPEGTYPLADEWLEP